MQYVAKVMHVCRQYTSQTLLAYVRLYTYNGIIYRVDLPGWALNRIEACTRVGAAVLFAAVDVADGGSGCTIHWRCAQSATQGISYTNGISHDPTANALAASKELACAGTRIGTGDDNSLVPAMARVQTSPNGATLFEILAPTANKDNHFIRATGMAGCIFI